MSDIFRHSLKKFSSSFQPVWRLDQTCIGAREVHRLCQLNESDVIVVFHETVVILMDVDLSHIKVLLGSIVFLQIPFPNTDLWKKRLAKGRRGELKNARTKNCREGVGKVEVDREVEEKED